MLALKDLVSHRNKPWGVNRHLLSLPGLELHHATIEPGGYSSKHYHAHKDNHFYVISGRLTVEFYYSDVNDAPLASQELGRGEQLVMRAGLWHRFVNHGPDAVELVETYWASPEKSHEDIVRADTGGRSVL